MAVRQEDLGSVIGPQGPQGIRGKVGPTGAKGDKGEDGAKWLTGTSAPSTQGANGDPFAIAKTYASVAAMNSGYATDGVGVGQFVVIDTGSVEDTDNAKLYLKGASAYSYITDMSGATGLTGT